MSRCVGDFEFSLKAAKMINMTTFVVDMYMIIIMFTCVMMLIFSRSMPGHV